VYELDDIGMPDEKTRDQLIQQTGLWELISEDNNRSVIGRVIKNALKISLKEVVDTLKSMLIIYVGTKTECEWISFLLKKEGVLTKIEKRDRY
jgi:hypothetical protein